MSSYSDETVAKLRVAVAAIGREITASPPTAAFEAAWTELVALLALGPAPETRVCPTCRNVGRREASRCGFCWAVLEAMPSLSPAPVEP